MILFLSQTDNVDDNWNQSQREAGGQAESQLRAELEESHKQLKCAHNALQEQKNKSLSLRYILFLTRFTKFCFI